MSVKNTKMGGTDWSDGQILYAADLNDTFDSAALRNLDEDTTVSSVSNGTTTFATLTIAASAVKRFIQVIVEFDGQGADGSVASQSCSLRLDIGVAASEAMKITRTVANMSTGSTGSDWVVTVGGSYTYYYEPSPTEKSTGFNVLVKGTSAGTSVTFNYYRSVVIGC